ncbi:carbohydrate ABC transporter permease [Pleomorphochaeta sp. DL1XJH-081]|uniref:carbohydrate ABC transporter permease n=1 Tax=Pleomorphochaeta sp. DL1XJH-081 TaxID=3409690 RepID=UPI003BB77331
MQIGYRSRRRIARIVLYIIMLSIGFVFIFPFIMMVLSSFKFNKDVLAVPVKIFPVAWNWGSYKSAFTYADYDFALYFINSFIVVIFAVGICIILSATAGYGFAKYKFRGNGILFAVVLSTIMIPFEAILVPLFLLVRSMSLQNTYAGLIIPQALTAFGVFMMRQFFYSMPDELIESARMDGANEYVVFMRISFPIARTAVLALIIFHAQFVWNMLVWPLIVISKPDMRTLPQAIALFSGVYYTPYPEQLAISVVACLPLLILYLFLSKYFVQGIAMTGLKG